MKYTIKQLVWSNGNFISQVDLLHRLKDNPQEALNSNNITFTNSDLDMRDQNWIQIGTADVIVTLNSTEQNLNKALEMFNKQKEDLKQEFTYRMQEVNDTIASLLALPNPNNK